MAQEIVVVERSKIFDPSDAGTVRGWRVRGCFLYVLSPVIETVTPFGTPQVIVPTPSIELPPEWREPAANGGMDLFRAAELAALDAGTGTFVVFDETLTEAQITDPGGAGRAFLQALYVQKDPRSELRWRYAFAGARVDAT